MTDGASVQLYVPAILPQAKGSPVLINMVLAGSHTWSGRFREENKFLHLPGNKPRSIFITPTTLPCNNTASKQYTVIYYGSGHTDGFGVGLWETNVKSKVMSVFFLIWKVHRYLSWVTEHVDSDRGTRRFSSRKTSIKSQNMSIQTADTHRFASRKTSIRSQNMSTQTAEHIDSGSVSTLVFRRMKYCEPLQ
jgi:hypothetical protein